MKKNTICLSLSILPLFVFCQRNSVTLKKSKDINFPVVNQRDASFPGGDRALQDYIIRNINFTDTAISKKIEGVITVSFDVIPDSTLTDIAVLKGLGYGIDEEVVRLLKPLKFAPGLTNGMKVKQTSIISLPLFAH